MVPWGLQSHDEMLYGDFVFSWTEERSDKPIHDNAFTESVQWVGFMDRDMNGSVGMDELPPSMRERLRETFALGDADGDGALTAAEFLAGSRAAGEDADDLDDADDFDDVALAGD